MPKIQIICEADGCWPDLRDLARQDALVLLTGPSAPNLQVALLPGFMDSDEPSVGMRLDLPDGRTLVTEIGLHALEDAVLAFQGYLRGQAEREGREPGEPDREGD